MPSNLSQENQNLISNCEFQPLLSRVFEHCPFAQRLIIKHPVWLPELIVSLSQPSTKNQIKDLFGKYSINNIEDLKHALRQVKNQVYLKTLVRDVGQLTAPTEVMATLSTLADFAVQIALQYIETWQQPLHGSPSQSEQDDPVELVVIALGKLGGYELNVSSDIDIIFAYSTDGVTDSIENPLSHSEYFTLIAKQLINVLDDITEDGYVFRVDTRLRPFGKSGPLVSSYDAIERYYQTHGRDWERYALIKARMIKGDKQKTLLDILKPFVYRKYFDFNAIDSLRVLKSQINLEVRKRSMQDNIKLGLGGIREIEFITQVIQLIRGGRLYDLQTTSTLQALDTIQKNNLLPPQTCEDLVNSYYFLRKLEHCLQYDQDNQTHTLPTDEAAQFRLIALLQVTSWEALNQQLDFHRQRTHQHFSQLLQSQSSDDSPSHIHQIWAQNTTPEQVVQTLSDIGYQDAEAVEKHLSQLKKGRRYQQLSSANKSKFDQLVHYTIEHAATTKYTDTALLRTLGLLENISGRSSYLSLFIEHPQALQQVLEMVSKSPYITTLLNQHPIMLDTLLDKRQLYQTIDKTSLELELNKQLSNIQQFDVELQMDLLREFKQSYSFRLAAQDIKNLLPLTKISDALSMLADLILQVILKLAWQQMKLDYEPKFLIVAYGKLGSKEFSYTSDIDIVFLYDDEHDHAMQSYIRFSQRINHWLSTYTPAGILFQTDFRLRPDGSKGLLAIPMSAFESYQKKRAWMWEHQALTRARWVAGNTKLGKQFETIRKEILCQQRDKDHVQHELVAMRKRIRDATPVKAGSLNIKHFSGGIIDIEFIVQFLILVYANQYPQLVDNTGNIALLDTAADLGLISPDLAKSTGEAYQAFRQYNHDKLLRDVAVNDTAEAKLKKMSEPVRQLWDVVFS